MKNIFICFYSINNVIAKYEDFAHAFVENGHNVTLCNMNPNNDMSKILSKIKDVKVDFVFSFNNVIPDELISIFDCRVLVLDADNPNMFWNKDTIKHKKKLYLGYQTCSKNLYKKIFNLKLNDRNYLYFPPSGTSLSSNPESSIKNNISFIGSNFYPEHLILNEMHNLTDLSIQENFEKIRKDYYYSAEENNEVVYNMIKDFYVGQHRMSYLSVLTDLGLKIYGDKSWLNMNFYSFDIVSCFDKKFIRTKEDNEYVYNSSKISVNISHPQATNSFSWRVVDIMASNSCLVMEFKKDWKSLFGRYVSKEVQGAIIYKDKYDMRQKCINLLSNEELRLKCIKECQNAVKKEGSWKGRLRDLEDFLQIKLLDINSDEISINNANINYIGNYKELHNDQSVLLECDGQEGVISKCKVSIIHISKVIANRVFKILPMGYILKRKICALLKKTK